MAQVRLKGIQVPLDIMNRDAVGLMHQGLATMVRVAQSDDLKHALAAAEWLVAYGERLMAERQAARTGPLPQIEGRGNRSDREQLLAELRGLYAKALGEAPLIVEAAAERLDVPEDHQPSRD